MRLFFLLVLLATGSLSANAQQDASRLSNLETRVTRVESKIRRASEAGPMLFLFGAFCALWAQNTGRSGWLWFFVGALFSVVAVLVLLNKNSADIDRRRSGSTST